MALDVSEPLGASAYAASQRRRAWVLFAAAAWNAYVWITRIGIVLDQDRTTPFRLVHGVLIVVSLAFAVAIAVIAWRIRRDAGAGRAAE